MDGYRRLALAILLRAARDAQSSNGVATEARRWLECDPFCHYLLDALDLDQRVVTAWVNELPAVAQPALFEL